MKRILVIGSYNVGLTVIGPRIPKVGETVLGRQFDMGPGGKGSNQAIAAARLGGQVAFLGKVGDDLFGREAMALFAREGIDTSHVAVEPGVHTGAGIIFVDSDGHNAIGVAPGANGRLTPADLQRHERLFDECGLLLIQLEIPIETVYAAIGEASRRRKFVIVNPAPAQPIEDRYYPMIDLLTPNETEAEILSGVPVTDRSSAVAAAKVLLARGTRSVIVTLGAAGAVLVTAAGERFFASYPVQAVDTTGAGDAFNGGLAYALADGRPLEESIDFGCRVGAFSTLQVGVVPGLPTLEQVRTRFG